MSTQRKIQEVHDTTQQIAVSIQFSTADVTLYPRPPYVAVNLERSTPLDEPGQPALPWRKFYISVSWDAEPSEAVIQKIVTKPFADNVIVEPCQPNVPLIFAKDLPWVEPDPEVYTSAIAWPPTIARFTVVRRTGAFALAEVEICPFRYYPNVKRLELVEQLEFVLHFTQPQVRQAAVDFAATLRYDTKFMQRVQAMVLNPTDVETHAPKTRAAAGTAERTFTPVEHVIITTRPLADAFQRLAQWRTQLGLRSQVVTTEDIIAGAVSGTNGQQFWYTTGYADGGTRDTAEAIRNFIKWANVHWSTDYVLLGGDTEIVPCRKALHSGGSNMEYRDITIPDLRFQCAKEPSTSSVASGHSAEAVLDDNQTTMWRCERTDRTPWLQVKLKEANTPINSVKLIWGPFCTPGYSLQISDDALAWREIYTTRAGNGGTEEIKFGCVSATYLRLSITSGPDFALNTLSVYGPSPWYAYKLNEITTRIFHSGIDMLSNPTNSVEECLVLVRDGPLAGKVIPYNEDANAQNLGWRFVNDLVAMPARRGSRFIEICGPAQYHQNAFVLKWYDNYFPTDLYYADIATQEYPGSQQHDWDLNGNRVYGEWYTRYLNNRWHDIMVDGVNGFPDICVGRAPVEAVDEVHVFVNKVINYERYSVGSNTGENLPPDFAVSVFLGARNLNTNVLGQLDSHAVYSEKIRSTLRSVAAERWHFLRRYEDASDVPVQDRTPDLDLADRNSMLNAVSRGNNIVSLIGHGYSEGCCCAPTGDCYLTTNDVSAVANHPGIFYAHSCSTNAFDRTAGKAFSECAILNPQGGAVAYVGFSRPALSEDNMLEPVFWTEMFNSGRLGEMFNLCKHSYPGQASYNLNLLGDPAMRVWSDRPKQLAVDHPAKIFIDKRPAAVSPSVTVTVTVSDGTTPMKGIDVFFSKEGGFWAKEQTNEAGAVQLLLTAGALGEENMVITVSDKNVIPYVGEMTISTGISCLANLPCLDNVNPPCNLLICERPLFSCPPIIGHCQMGIVCGPRIGSFSAERGEDIAAQDPGEQTSPQISKAMRMMQERIQKESQDE